MHKPRAAKSIERSPLLRTARRVLFTHSGSPTPHRFQLEHFFQFGTGIVIIRRGYLYLITASHVVRNATSNMYSNDSPFWITREHKRPDDIADFLMPMRFLDLDSGGESGRDVALAELATSMRPVPDHLDWDDASAFVNFPMEASGTTAVAVGYPAELNGYTFAEPDNVPSANVVRKTFRGYIEVNGDEVWFRNENHRENFDYAGLSGGLVVCYAAGRPKCLGIAISRGDGGRRFRGKRPAIPS